MRLISYAMAILLSASGLTAQDLSDIVVHRPQIAASIGSAKAGAGYVSIENKGAVTVKLLAAEADFPRVMIHNTVFEDGLAKMVHLHEGIEIPAGETLHLEQGGMHIMFMGIGMPFRTGDTIPTDLIFESIGKLEVEFDVVPREEIGGGMMDVGHDHD